MFGVFKYGPSKNNQGNPPTPTLQKRFKSEPISSGSKRSLSKEHASGKFDDISPRLRELFKRKQSKDEESDGFSTTPSKKPRRIGLFSRFMSQPSGILPPSPIEKLVESPRGAQPVATPRRQTAPAGSTTAATPRSIKVERPESEKDEQERIPFLKLPYADSNDDDGFTPVNPPGMWKNKGKYLHIIESPCVTGSPANL